jgi:hypothetical protein
MTMSRVADALAGAGNQTVGFHLATPPSKSFIGFKIISPSALQHQDDQVSG